MTIAGRNSYVYDQYWDLACRGAQRSELCNVPAMDDPEEPDPRHERIARAVEGDHAGMEREPGTGAASTALERLARAGRALRASQVREAPGQAMYAEQAEQPGDSP